MSRRETVDKTLSAHHHENAPLTLSAAPGGHTPPHTSSNLARCGIATAACCCAWYGLSAKRKAKKKLMARRVLTEDYSRKGLGEVWILAFVVLGRDRRTVHRRRGL